jgi:hypothetical protein
LKAGYSVRDLCLCWFWDESKPCGDESSASSCTDSVASLKSELNGGESSPASQRGYADAARKESDPSL